MRLRSAICAVAFSGLIAPAAEARAPRLGTPEVITWFGGESNLLEASSVAGHPDAYAVFHRKIGANVYSVVHRDRRGHAHRFDIPTTRGSFPQAIRIVPLESGAGMALWDDSASARVLARAWTRDGRLGPSAVVLSGVTTVHSAENDSAQWRVRADGRGTVVVASSGAAPHDPASVLATVREPGGAFRPQQQLTPPGETGVLQRQIRISPIGGDGSVAVAWGPEYGDGPGGIAVRRGRAPAFDPPLPRAFESEVVLSARNRSVFAADGTPVAISARLARRCPCVRPQVFRWGRTRVLAFQVYATSAGFELGTWYVARPDRSGVFDRAILATTNASSRPVRRKRAGELGFARFDTSTDSGLFRRRSRLIVIPFGARVPRSRRAARLRFGTYALANARRLLAPVYCDRVCRVRGTSRGRRLRVTDSKGRRIDSRLEPFTVAYLRVPLGPGRRHVQVNAAALDDAARPSAARGTFLRSRRATLWCLGRTRC
jgi:hypothetical protein